MRHSQDLVHVVVGEFERLLHERGHFEEGRGHQDGEDVAGFEEGSRLGVGTLPLLSLLLLLVLFVVVLILVLLLQEPLLAGGLLAIDPLHEPLKDCNVAVDGDVDVLETLPRCDVSG